MEVKRNPTRTPHTQNNPSTHNPIENPQKNSIHPQPKQNPAKNSIDAQHDRSTKKSNFHRPTMRPEPNVFQKECKMLEPEHQMKGNHFMF